MARNHARIQTNIWSEESDFRLRSPDEQWLFLVLLSQPDLSPCGVIQFSAKRLARLAVGMTPKRVERARDELAAARFLVVDLDTDEVCFRTFLHHDGITQSPNLLKSAARAAMRIHSSTIRRAVEAQVPEALRHLWPEALLGTDPRTLNQTLTGTLPPNPSGKPSANPSANGSANGSGTSRAGARAGAGSPDPGALIPDGVSDSKSSSSSSNPGEDRAVEEEEVERKARAAAAVLAERALKARRGEPLNNPRSWVAKVADERYDEHHTALYVALEQDPEVTPHQLASLIEAGGPKRPPPPRCEHCVGGWVVPDEGGDVVRCEHCKPAKVRR